MACGLVGSVRQKAFSTRNSLIEQALSRFSSLGLTSGEAARLCLAVNQDGRWRSACELMASPQVGLARVLNLWPELGVFPQYAIEAAEAEALYSGYLGRQASEIELLRKDEAAVLPAWLDYMAMPSLSTEIRLKLTQVRPATLAQASRIDGMTPAALAVLLSHARRPSTRKTA
jgi:tRNA uridine 5-carboxymethylaminomethyl modification enzyme